MMAILSSPLQLISSTPITTRTFTAATVLFSLAYHALRWQTGNPYSTPYLTLIPGTSIFYPWTFFTAALVETSVIELIFTLLTVPISLRYFERLWGPIETLKFIVAVTVLSNVISVIANWLEFLLTRNADLFLYGMDYHGQMALQTGILVAFTQLMPEHQVQLFGIFKARVKRLPMAYVTISTVLCLVGLQSPWIIIQFGWLISYVYLRFYKKNKGDSIVSESYGDRSETFAFVHWFPPFLNYPITLLSNFLFNLATKFHLIPNAGSDLESSGYSQVPGGPRAEAERRRTLALKALDQRLASAATQPKPTSLQAHVLQGSDSPSIDRPTTPSENGGRPHEQRSVGEVDLGVSGTGSDSKGKRKSED